jgi:threonine synthase
MKVIDEWCRTFNLPYLQIQDESKNPFGTWKDRRSQVIIKKAKDELIDTLCLITSGNAGFSLAKFAEGSNIRVVAIIDTGLPQSIKETLKGVCTKVIETDLSEKILTPEEVIALVRESDTEVIWDVTNGFHEAYEAIIEEIQSEAPDYIICPVGSGEAFVGLFSGLQKLDLKTKLIGVKPQALPSFADKLHTPWTPYAAKINTIVEAGHEIIELTEEEIHEAYTETKALMECEPSSALVIGALSKYTFKSNDKVILINSGKGLVI